MSDLTAEITGFVEGDDLEVRRTVTDLPAAIANDPAAYTGCIAGAAPVVELERMIADAGFEQVRVRVQTSSRDMVEDWSPGSGAAQVVASALIEAIKPA